MNNLKYSSYYENWHPDTTKHQDQMIKTYKAILKKYYPSISSSQSVLELGCGGGFCLLALKELGVKKVKGIDLDEGQVAICKGRGLDVSQSGVEEWLEKCSEEYDLIIAIDLLEHINKEKVYDVLFAVMKRLKDGGAFICQVPNCYSIAGSAYRYVDWTHHSSFSSYSLNFLLRSSGFSEISIMDMKSFHRPSIFRTGLLFKWFKAKLARRIWRFLLETELSISLKNMPLSANILCVALK